MYVCVHMYTPIFMCFKLAYFNYTYPFINDGFKVNIYLENFQYSSWPWHMWTLKNVVFFSQNKLISVLNCSS